MKNYTKILQESKLYLEEGLWAKFLTFIESPNPKHPKFKSIMKRFETAMAQCNSMYPDKETTFDLGGKVKDYNLDVSYNNYEQNPEGVRCRAEAQLAIYKEWQKFFKTTKPEVICRNNRNKKRCMNYVQEVLSELKWVIPDLEREVKSMRRRKLSKSQFSKFKKLVK